MGNYKNPSEKNWTGRSSDEQLYMHEKVQCVGLDDIGHTVIKKGVALLGYSCDEGVKRNQGRPGAKDGPKVIRQALAKMPNHQENSISLFDTGDINCTLGKMEEAQSDLRDAVDKLLSAKVFPIVLGGGHDMAYGHFNGIKKFLGRSKKSLGIINFDAHFDLRNNENGNNSGTPFFQIAQDCKESSEDFKYLCLGIREDANDRQLFETAQDLEVKFLLRETFRMQFVEEINKWIVAFLNSVDYVYVTIDLDGFSSAFAPGVSAPSPMGFSQDIVLESLKTILASNKMISMDIAELNPKYDVDGRTAKLGASLIHFIIARLF